MLHIGGGGAGGGGASYSFVFYAIKKCLFIKSAHPGTIASSRDSVASPSPS